MAFHGILLDLAVSVLSGYATVSFRYLVLISEKDLGSFSIYLSKKLWILKEKTEAKSYPRKILAITN